jgi:hypothetical protein
VITADLETGREVAKTKRKGLNQRCEQLRERLLASQVGGPRLPALRAGPGLGSLAVTLAYPLNGDDVMRIPYQGAITRAIPGTPGRGGAK